MEVRELRAKQVEQAETLTSCKKELVAQGTAVRAAKQTSVCLDRATTDLVKAGATEAQLRAALQVATAKWAAHKLAAARGFTSCVAAHIVEHAAGIILKQRSLSLPVLSHLAPAHRLGAARGFSSCVTAHIIVEHAAGTVLKQSSLSLPVLSNMAPAHRLGAARGFSSCVTAHKIAEHAARIILQHGTLSPPVLLHTAPLSLKVPPMRSVLICLHSVSDVISSYDESLQVL